MKVIQVSAINKAFLPVKYTQNIKYCFDSLGLDQEVTLR